MAMKYYCDGCDKEIPHGSVRTTSVRIQVSGQVTQATGDYELCKGCADTMIRDGNPRNWTRVHAVPKQAHGF